MRITTTDYHTGGEPFRIVTSGVPALEGTTVGERRLWASDNLDEVRELLINEPRGHADMYGGFVTPPDDEHGDLGVVFFHNEGYSTACGHGTIALATWAVETGQVTPPDGAREVSMAVDTPSGRLHVLVTLDADGRVGGTSFRNVPAFVKAEIVIATGTGETAPATVAFGGAFYLIVEAAALGLTITPRDLPRIIEVCRNLKNDLNASYEWVHPHDDRLSDIYGVILVEDVADVDRHSVGADVPLMLGDPSLGVVIQRNVTVFADGEVDRSPTGSGTSARLASLYHHRRIALGQGLMNLSIVDTMMGGVVDAESIVGVYPAVETRVSGQAFRTGTHEFTLDPRDPMGTGFQLR